MDSSHKKCSNILEGTYISFDFFHIKKKKKKRGEVKNFVVEIYSRKLSHFLFHIRLSRCQDSKFSLIFEITNGSSDLYFFLYVLRFPRILSVACLRFGIDQWDEVRARVRDEIINDWKLSFSFHISGSGSVASKSFLKNKVWSNDCSFVEVTIFGTIFF